MTQGTQVFRALRRKPHTYLDMLRIGAGLSPWKRLREYMRLHDGWKLVKGKTRSGLVTWRVERA